LHFGLVFAAVLAGEVGTGVVALATRAGARTTRGAARTAVGAGRTGGSSAGGFGHHAMFSVGRHPLSERNSAAAASHGHRDMSFLHEERVVL
jgi:hypothetical protein